MLMHNYIKFSGINTMDYGIRINGRNTFGAPERDETVISVPGKNGDVVLDNGRWKNSVVTYECSIARDFRHRFDSFRQAVMAAHGYQRMEDTYHPDEYYIARLSGGQDPNVNLQLDAGTFTLTFDRKPQRFLKSGEIPIGRDGENSVTMNNPTPYAARPLMRCWTNGPADDTLYLSYKPEYAATPYVIHYQALTSILSEELSAEDYEAAVEAGLYVDIDCETGECYGVYQSDGEDVVINLNSVFALTPDGELPYLRPGETHWVTTLDGFQVIPRWFTL